MSIRHYNTFFISHAETLGKPTWLRVFVFEIVYVYAILKIQRTPRAELPRNSPRVMIYLKGLKDLADCYRD